MKIKYVVTTNHGSFFVPTLSEAIAEVESTHSQLIPRRSLKDKLQKEIKRDGFLQQAFTSQNLQTGIRAIQ